MPYTQTTQGILHAGFGLIWTTPWPDNKDLVLKFANREFRKFPYEIITFFLDKLLQKFLSPTLYLHRGYFIPSLVQFGQVLDQSNITSVKIRYSQNSQISVWKPNFFPRQALPKVIGASDSVYTDYEFELIWTTSWPDQKALF